MSLLPSCCTIIPHKVRQLCEKNCGGFLTCLASIDIHVIICWHRFGFHIESNKEMKIATSLLKWMYSSNNSQKATTKLTNSQHIYDSFLEVQLRTQFPVQSDIVYLIKTLLQPKQSYLQSCVCLAGSPPPSLFLKCLNKVFKKGVINFVVGSSRIWKRTLLWLKKF